MKSLITRNNILPTSGKANLILSGQQKLTWLRKGISKAKEYIYIEYYMLEDGKALSFILPAIKSAIERGVEVRVIYDAVGTPRKKRSGIKKLQLIGCKVAKFKLSHKVRGILRINNRDHRKVVIIDGLEAFTGGMNFADKYYFNDDWVDAHLWLTGGVVTAFEFQFLKTWQYLTGQTVVYKYPKVSYLDEGLDFVLSSPDKRAAYNDAWYNKRDLIYNAKERIRICSPYVFVDKSIEKILKQKIDSGVQVEFYVPQIPDSKIVAWTMGYQLKRLQGLGCKIILIKKFPHAKIMLVDDSVACVGSSNFDMRSFRINYELDINLRDKSSLRWVKHFFDFNGFNYGITNPTFKSNLIQKILFHLLKNQL